MLALLAAGLGIEDDISESDWGPALSLNFTKGEVLFFRALSRSKLRAIADLVVVGGGVDIFTFSDIPTVFNPSQKNKPIFLQDQLDVL